MKTFMDDLTEDQRKEVLDLLIYTIKEMREEIATQIENTAADWKLNGKLKSRKTKKAFEESANIARGIQD